MCVQPLKTLQVHVIIKPAINVCEKEPKFLNIFLYTYMQYAIYRFIYHVDINVMNERLVCVFSVLLIQL